MQWHSFTRKFSVQSKTIRNVLFGKYLIVTNTVTSGILMGTADAVEQTAEKYRNKLKAKHVYDWTRTFRMFVVGLALGPLVHSWYTGLDKFWPGTYKIAVTKKVFADQIVASPAFLFLFFTGMGNLEGKMFAESFEEFKLKFPFMYFVEWFFWPPAQAINFMYLPPQYRVVYVNCLILLWDSFLSYMKHSEEAPPNPFMHKTEASKKKGWLGKKQS